MEVTASQLWAKTSEPPDVTVGEANCHWINRGDIAEMKQSDWCCHWKSGEVEGHKRWWPATAAQHSVQETGFLSVMQLGLSWGLRSGSQDPPVVVSFPEKALQPTRPAQLAGLPSVRAGTPPLPPLGSSPIS